MTIPWNTVAWSGFVATALAASLLALLRVWKLTPIDPATLLGCILLKYPRSPATVLLGFGLLFSLGSSLVPALYFYLMNHWDNVSWEMGAFLGTVHGAMSVLLLPVVGTISACVRNGQLSAPGWFGLRWGWILPVGVMTAHVIYGTLVGAILAAF